MAWKIEWRESAVGQMEKLGHTARQAIHNYLRGRIATEEDPKRFGKPLRGDKLGLWRYRVGDYRIVCRIEEERLTVLVVTIGHRRDVYDD